MNPDKLFDYLDGKLSPADRAQLEEKLMADPQLRQQFNIAREIHRGGGVSREMVQPVEDPAAVARGGKLGRRIATAAAVLVFLNVAVGLSVIAFKNKKSNRGPKETEMRQQLAASLGAAAQNAMPPPSFASGELIITAPRSDWELVVERILAGAEAFGGSAAKGLPERNLATVLVDIPSGRDAEFRRAVTSAGAISPMPAISRGATGEDANFETAGTARTIVQIRIAEAAP